MGLWSRLMEILTNRKQQSSPQTPSTVSQPSVKPSSATEVADSTSLLESLPSEEVAQQVDQAQSELAAIAPEQPLVKQKAEPMPSHAHTTTADNPDNLEDKILSWGNAKQLKYIPQLLTYANNPNAHIRAAVALALGKIAKANPRKAEVQRTISVLGNLSGDRVPEVSQNAVIALGTIRSEQVLPLLQKALRHPSGKVSKAASYAIKQLHLLHEVKPEVLTIKPPAKPIHHRFHH